MAFTPNPNTFFTFLGMKWKTEFNKKYNLVVLTYNGLISTQELYDSSAKTIDLTNKYGVYKILVEARKYRTNSARGELFRMPNELYTKWGMNKLMQTAVVEPKDFSAKSIAHFYEIASRNLGWEARVFPDRKAALNWLLEP